jgi:hypothetical protein
LLLVLPQTGEFFSHYLYSALICLAIKTTIITIAMLNAVFIFDANENKFVYAVAILLLTLASFLEMYLVLANLSLHV